MKNNPRPRKLSRLATPIESAILLVASASLFAFLARYIWIADLLCQFRVQYMLIMLPAIVAYVVAKQPKKAIFLFVCLSANSWVLLPSFTQGKLTNESKDQIKRVIVFNVLSSNKRYEELRAFVKKNKPDIFIALETNQSWIDNMQPSLVSPDIWINDFRVGPNLGSDHRPIIVDFTLSE